LTPTHVAIAVATAVALAVTVVLTPVLAGFARRLGAVDHPGALKPHERPTPYGGGISIGAGMAVGIALARPWLFVPFAMALVLGTVDDVRPLSPAVRLGGEISIGVVLALVVSTRFTGVLGGVLCVATTVVLVNGFNLMDGLDALCGSVTLVMAAGFGAVLTGDGRLLALALAGAAAGFLVYNVPPARVYLGDGGSYLVGTVVTALVALAWAPHAPMATGLAALVLVTLPAAEVGLAVVRRLRGHQSVFSGDRRHPYDQLVERSWPKGVVALTYAGTALVLAAVAVVASTSTTFVAGLLLALTVAVVVTVSLVAGFLSPHPTRPSGDAAGRP
jgi:UDP-N-acetylmuramyl pentapeptide phosphotransferase/UDP-N-acetylglucosamine-1-phosphate transferase